MAQPILYNHFFAKKTLLFIALAFLVACSKSIEEPKHQNKGRNFVYLKLDDTEHLIQEGLHFNKSAKGEIWGYDEYDYKPRVETSNINGKETFDVKIGFRHKDYYPVSNSGIVLEMVRGNDGLVLERVRMSVRAYSEKHQKIVDIDSWKFFPHSFQLEHLDEKKQKIALSFGLDYKEDGSQADSGTFYFYMDADYATYKKR